MDYCIGDIQGCAQELHALLAKIKFDPSHDKLWFVGDLVNRGPESLNVIRFIKSLGDRAIVVLGNHDLHLLASVHGLRNKTKDTITDIISAPDCQELCAWLRTKPLLYHDEKLGYTMVHAGIPPQWDLKKAKACAQEVETVLRSKNYLDYLKNMYGDKPCEWNDNLTGWDRLRIITNYFTRLRFCTPTGCIELDTKGEPDNPPPGYLPWFKIPNRATKNSKIVFGHWAALMGRAREPNIFAVDTGCVWGNCLTALCLQTEERISVTCESHGLSIKDLE